MAWMKVWNKLSEFEIGVLVCGVISRLFLKGFVAHGVAVRWKFSWALFIDRYMCLICWHWWRICWIGRWALHWGIWSAVSVLRHGHSHGDILLKLWLINNLIGMETNMCWWRNHIRSLSLNLTLRRLIALWCNNNWSYKLKVLSTLFLCYQFSIAWNLMGH